LLILGWNMWTEFCFVQRKQSKAKQASKQSYESELFSSLINMNKAVICTPLLFAGLSGRSEPKKWAISCTEHEAFLCHWDEWMRRGCSHDIMVWGGRLCHFLDHIYMT
jgi:hypothetical protein